MSDDAYGATVAKRRLARRLTELRIQQGYTANQVCDRLNWGRGKVGRFEANTWVRPEMSDIRDLLRLYDVDTEVQQELEDLAVRARERPWWREYGDVFDNEFAGYESDATRINVYFPLVIPGLLQTPGYMEAQMRINARSSSWRNRAVGARLRRQEILSREENPPELVGLITEASLLYTWGAIQDRRAQIAHLAEMSRLENVQIRLLLFAAGPHPSMSSAISIFEFPGDEPSLVFLESETAIQEVTKPDELEIYTTTFERINDIALNAEESTAYLDQLAETLE